MKLILASNNKNKISELDALMKGSGIEGVEILSLADIGYTDEIEETGETFEENARIKAKTIADLGYCAVADDSGLCVDALGGAPGVYSARYCGHHGDDEANNRKLLEDLANVPDEKRTAYFMSSIVCVMPDIGREIAVYGKAHGIILHEKHGCGGFGYDPLFYYPPLDKTFAELTPDEKNTVSHRGAAFRKFAEEFRKIKGL
ncbi:MAG: XTP/dITP diphosphatase [Clostridia bacterium]|nr:XTP/dITP diphosphatase [Clostridia bacterium]